ncbi:MAG TPA: DNA repair protein RadA [bacterium]|nr:DNA repair protein RadA [bacterium]
MSQNNLYHCSHCDAQFPKWSGRCSECGTWGSVVQSAIADFPMMSVTKKGGAVEIIKPAALIDLNKLESTKNEHRLQTGVEEIDRVFGGGLVDGSFILIGGEPGIGKSTIVAQIANAIGQKNLVIYASGEESTTQVSARLNRLACKLDNIKFTSETNADKIIAAAMEAKPRLLIVDSIQTIYTAEAPGEAGSLTQIRASAAKFLGLAKQHNITIILIGHITKDGQLAGPKSLEHIVDTVIYLETDSSQNYRLLRATKNRFGSINEIGIFAMTGTGFEAVSNSSAIFLEQSETEMPGSVISAVMEGTRPFLVEIQALVSKTIFGYPQRKTSGFDANRLQVLAAVMAKRSKINLMTQDIILNMVGGLKINDPGLDLAVCLAITSSMLNKAIKRDWLVLGEVGLGGEIRPVTRLDDKLREAEKLGFTTAIIPDQKTQVTSGGISIIRVKNISEAIGKI